LSATANLLQALACN